MDKHFKTRRILDELAELIKTLVNEYLEDTTRPPQTIKVSSDYANSRYEKPMVLVFPKYSDPEDSGECMVDDHLTVEVFVYITGSDELRNVDELIDYADSLRSLFIDNHQTDSAYDIQVGIAQYYTGATVTEKLASIEIECIARTARE